MGLEPPSDFKKRDLIFAISQCCIHRHSADPFIVEIRSSRELLITSWNQARRLSEIHVPFRFGTVFMACVTEFDSCSGGCGAEYWSYE
jgi:hypothetical protein